MTPKKSGSNYIFCKPIEYIKGDAQRISCEFKSSKERLGAITKQTKK